MNPLLIIQAAIYGNEDALFGLDPVLFVEREEKEICKYIAKTFVANHKINFDLLRAAVNGDKYQMNRRDILDKIIEIENGTYAYTDDMIPDLLETLKDQYKIKIAQITAQRLLKAGTDECTVEDVYRLSDELQTALEYGSEAKNGVDFIEMCNIIANQTIESLQDNRLYFSKSVKRKTLRDIYGEHLKQKMYVISGKSQSGKNALSDNVIVDLGLEGKKGIIFSFDNNTEETTNSLISCANEINYETVENRMFTEEQRKSIVDVNVNCKIFDNVMNAYQMRKIVRQHKDYDYFLIDYFTMINIPKGNPVLEFARSAQIIQKLCNEFKMTGIILSQLNSDNEIAWCKELFKAAYHVIRIDRIPNEQGEIDIQNYDRKIIVDKFKKGAPKMVDITFNPCIGRIYTK